jgi:hypothetical protein
VLRHCPGGTRLIRWTLLRHASDRQRVGRAEPRRPMRMYEAHCGQLTERHGPGVRRAADYRSIPLERGATLPDPRSRRALRSRCQAPITGHGGSRGPFRNSSSRACLPTNRSRAAIRGFVFLDQVGGSSIVVEGAFLVFADPDTDQVTPADNQIGRYW